MTKDWPRMKRTTKIQLKKLPALTIEWIWLSNSLQPRLLQTQLRARALSPSAWALHARFCYRPWLLAVTIYTRRSKLTSLRSRTDSQAAATRIRAGKTYRMTPRLSAEVSFSSTPCKFEQLNLWSEDVHNRTTKVKMYKAKALCLSVRNCIQFN